MCIHCRMVVAGFTPGAHHTSFSLHTGHLFPCALRQPNVHHVRRSNSINLRSSSSICNNLMASSNTVSCFRHRRVRPRPCAKPSASQHTFCCPCGPYLLIPQEDYTTRAKARRAAAREAKAQGQPLVRHYLPLIIFLLCVDRWPALAVLVLWPSVGLDRAQSGTRAQQPFTRMMPTQATSASHPFHCAARHMTGRTLICLVAV